MLRPRALLLSLAAGLRLHSSLLQLGVANKDCQVDTILMMAERYPAALFPQNKDGDTVLDILFTEARRRHDEQNAAIHIGTERGKQLSRAVLGFLNLDSSLLFEWRTQSGLSMLQLALVSDTGDFNILAIVDKILEFGGQPELHKSLEAAMNGELAVAGSGPQEDTAWTLMVRQDRGSELVGKVLKEVPAVIKLSDGEGRTAASLIARHCSNKEVAITVLKANRAAGLARIDKHEMLFLACRCGWLEKAQELIKLGGVDFNEVRVGPSFLSSRIFICDCMHRRRSAAQRIIPHALTTFLSPPALPRWQKRRRLGAGIQAHGHRRDYAKRSGCRADARQHAA